MTFDTHQQPSVGGPALAPAIAGCPICRNQDMDVEQPFPEEPDWAVTCLKCGMIGSQADTPVKAVEEWNASITDYSSLKERLRQNEQELAEVSRREAALRAELDRLRKDGAD